MALAAASCVSLGAGVAWLAKKYILRDPQEEKLKQKQLEEENERKKKDEELRQANLKTMEELTNALKHLQTQQSEVKDLVKNISTSPVKQQPTAGLDNTTKTMIAEMQAQINSLKAQIIDVRSSAWSPSTSK